MMHVEIETWKYKTYRYSVKTYADPERKMFGTNICTSDGYENEKDAYKAAIAWLNEEHRGHYKLMNPRQYESRFGRVRAEVDLQVWRNDYAMTFKELEFDCAPALDEYDIDDVEAFTENADKGSADENTDDLYFTAMGLGLVESHDGPFSCYIEDYDEFIAYLNARKEKAC